LIASANEDRFADRKIFKKLACVKRWGAFRFFFYAIS
jgi:hypothetical protein